MLLITQSLVNNSLIKTTPPPTSLYTRQGQREGGGESDWKNTYIWSKFMK